MFIPPGLKAISTSPDLPDGVMAMSADVLARRQREDPGFPRNTTILLLPGRGRLIVSPGDYARFVPPSMHEGDPAHN